MKDMMKKLTGIFLIVILTVSLYACGSSEPDPNAGIYKGSSAEMGGVSIDLVEVFGDDLSIELKNGGKAVFNYDGESYKIKWSLEGTAFHAEGGGAELDGTLADGVMVLEDVLGSGVTITLQR